MNLFAWPDLTPAKCLQVKGSEDRLSVCQMYCSSRLSAANSIDGEKTSFCLFKYEIAVEVYTAVILRAN